MPAPQSTKNKRRTLERSTDMNLDNLKEKVNMREINLSQIIQLGTILVVFALGWGSLKTDIALNNRDTQAGNENINKYIESNNKRLEAYEDNDREQDLKLERHDQALKGSGLLSRVSTETIASGQSAKLTPTPAPTPVVITYNYSIESTKTPEPKNNPEPTRKPDQPEKKQEEKPEPVVSRFVERILDIVTL